MESGSPQRRSRSSSPLRGTPGIAFVLVLLCLSGLPLGGGAAPSPSAPITSSVHPPPVPATVTAYVHNVTTGDLSNFWGVGVTPDTPLTNTTAEVASTPIHWYEWPAGKIADAYNMTSGQVWTNGFASYDASNETQFVQWCKSTSCHAIFAVPGETNNTTTAAWDVAYTENVLGFHPDYWQVGNEPYGWSHFGLPWARWTTTNTLNVTATVYAQVVNRYIAAMRAVDPTLQFIGLSGVGAGKSPDMPWIGATVALNGPNLSAIAIHTYPAEHRGTSGTAAGFLGTLLGTDAPQYRIPNDTKAILANCTAYWPSNATCVGIRLFVDEFGSGTGTTGGWQPFMQTYPEVPFITAELLTMIRANVTNADLYDLRSSYNGSLFNLTGSPLPLDSLYTHILPHFDSTPLLTTMTPTVGPVFAEASESTQSNSVTLLAVNTNTVQNITLKVRGPVFPSYGSFSAWRASDPNGSANGTFTHSTGFGLLSSWLLPPMGVLLVSMCRPVPSASAGNSVYPVTFCEAGLPSGTNWSITVGASTVYSTSSSITFYEPNGTIGYHIGGVANWSTASPSGFVTVNATPASVSVPWTEVTYPVSFLENGLPGGVPWSVVVNGTVYRSTTNTINLNAPNGTHSYAIGVVPGWTVSNFHGN
ncbi:MAG: hypothetical protein L3K10_06385, partial [Thermoplasmata archaeon]|nr:hypothetical protein [Thermoplasmata archaeon]